MGTTKAGLFTEVQNNIAAMAKALGHPARIAIIEYLLKVDQCICGDIVNELPLAQPTISQHLKELKNASLIKGNVEGTAICYCIDEAAIEKLQGYFGGIAVKLEKRKTIAADMKEKLIKYKKPIIITTSVIVLQVIFGFDAKFCIINIIWLLV